MILSSNQANVRSETEIELKKWELCVPARQPLGLWICQSVDLPTACGLAARPWICQRLVDWRLCLWIGSSVCGPLWNDLSDRVSMTSSHLKPNPLWILWQDSLASTQVLCVLGQSCHIVQWLPPKHPLIIYQN